MRFLELDGVGDIAGPTFQEAVGALYGLAYPVKFAAKRQLDLAYKVAPLKRAVLARGRRHKLRPGGPRTSLSWRLMIMVPNDVSGGLIEGDTREGRRQEEFRRVWPISASRPSTEGTSMQILHIGPYADEGSTVERLFAFAEERGYEITGEHHEIYLGDPNRAAAGEV